MYVARAWWIRVTTHGLEGHGLLGWRRQTPWSEVRSILPVFLPAWWVGQGHEATDGKHMKGIPLPSKSIVADESIESLRMLHDRFRGEWPAVAEKLFTLYCN